MINFIVCLVATGEIVRSGACNPDQLSAVADGVVEVAMEAPAGVDGNTHYVDDDDNLVAYSVEAARAKLSIPNGNFVWSPSTGAWIDNRTLAEVRSAVLERLKITRDSRINGGFVWDGSTFDSDAQISQPRLLGLFTTAIAGGIPAEGYPWRLKDNSWRVLSAADAQGVWGAFQMWMASHFAAFAAHEATALAETDIDALRSYDTEADWP